MISLFVILYLIIAVYLTIDETKPTKPTWNPVTSRYEKGSSLKEAALIGFVSPLLFFLGLGLLILLCAIAALLLVLGVSWILTNLP